MDIAVCDADLLPVCRQDLFCGFPAHIPDLTFQLAHTRFLRIIARHFPDRMFAEGELFRCKTVFFKLFRDQVFQSNMQLFILRITADLDHFHTVEQRSRDRLKGVRCSDEHYFRQIQRHFQIMIPEFTVLFAVQHFQKS